jgi:hypothetical protein
MNRLSLIALSSLAVIAFVLSSCVGGRTEADPSKHPDKWERKAARHGIYY